jgi:hypothetical protein
MVSVQISGRVTPTYSDFGTIGAGTGVTGLYTYDDTLVPSGSNPFNGWYGPITAALNFADGSSVSSDEAKILVNNNSSGIGSIDGYGVQLPGTPGGVTGAFAGYVANGWVFARQDPTGTAWDGIALPDPETVLTRLLVGTTFLFFRDQYGVGDEKFVEFEITDFSVVPVPGALLLGAIGLGCSHRLLRRRSI